MSKIGQRGKKICSGKFLDGQKDAWAEEWTEGRMDRLTDHHRAPAEQGLNNYNSLLNRGYPVTFRNRLEVHPR